MTRNMYHYPKMTDLSKMKSDAIAHSKSDGPVVIHLHAYSDSACDMAPEGHISFENGKDVSIDVADTH